MLAFLPMCLVFLLSPKLLRMADQDEQVIECTCLYMLFMAPAIVIYGLNDLQRKFLN